ncbi:MAG: S-layer protein [Candidatus Aenigmarchaeota archaeon]|nr:S-layer protein [Candidatus Aenigmarchaeota archaeon]
MKKIIATIMTAIMCVAPLAMAYDLGDYPTFLFKDHNLNAYVVVGADAASADVVGAVDLAARLAGESYEEVSTGTTTETTTVTGDSFKIYKTSDFLEYDEQLDGVVDVLTSDDLAGLAGGTFTNSKGSFKYNEYITVPENAYVEFVTDPDDDTDTPANYLFFTTDTYAYIYKIEFPTALEATIADVDTQLEDKTITMLGKDYTIVDATRNAEDDWTLTLMGGAVSDIINYGEEKTYTIGDTTYTVELTFVDATYCKFKVNDEYTSKLQDSETYTLADGNEIGVTEINYQDYAGGVQQCKFYLGAEKIILDDSEIEDDDNFDAKLTYGSNSLSNTAVKIKGSDDGTTLKISSIEIKWTPDDDLYIPVGGKLSEKEDSGEAGQVFGDMDIEFVGVQQSSTEQIKLKPKGDDEYELEFTNGAGQTIDLPYLDCDTSTLNLGSEDKALHLAEPDNATYFSNASDSTLIEKNEYFVVTSDKSTYVLQYKGSEADDNTLEFKDVGSGDDITITYSTTNIDDEMNDTADATLTLGGKTFSVWVESDSDDSDIAVDLDDSGALVANHEVDIYTKYGALIDIDASTTTNGFTLQTEELDDGTNKENITVSFSCSSDAVDINTINGGVPSSATVDTVDMRQIGDSDDYKEISRYGVILEETKYTNSPDKLTITYPDDQTEALVYVTIGATTTSTSSGTTGGTVKKVVPITNAVAKLDTEISDPASVTKNLVLVGGPGVNKLSAKVLGLDYPTYGSSGLLPFDKDEGYIKVFDDATAQGFGDGQVVVLVAGWEAKDTRNACSVLQQFETFADALDGNVAVKVTSVSSSGITAA